MMHVSVCTISFRHQLISLPDLASWAQRHGFHGIELWGIHARNLQEQRQLNADWIRSQNLSITMLSDYLPMDGDDVEAARLCLQLCKLADHWGSRKIRTFAGKCASATITAPQWDTLVTRLQLYCRIANAFGLELLIETHPHTCADTTASTLRLLNAVDHPALKINFDVLHIWEAGECPLQSWQSLAPNIRHLHLKNISHRKHLPVFEPANIYAAAGSREGIVPLFQGAYDYHAFLAALPDNRMHELSLEWFGTPVQSVLEKDSLMLLHRDSQAAPAASIAIPS